MSEDRRPRRILAPETPPPQALPPPPDLASVLLQHRFQRVLAAPKRFYEPPRDRRSMKDAPRGFSPLQAEPEAPRRELEPPSAHAATSAAIASNEASARRAQAKAAAPRPRPAGAAAVAPAACREAGPHEMPPRADPLQDPQAWRHAGLTHPAPQGWEHDLAERIVRLCRRADPAFQAWQVTVPLDPAVLPATELHMALSRERLGLRFHTQSTYSQALVSRHAPRLVALLSQALPEARDIDVETT
jgi:hypothetical protein